MSTDADQTIGALRVALNSRPAGEICNNEKEQIKMLLSEAWELFDGHDQGATDAYKLYRAEKLQWQSPTLSFLLERHGRTNMGSTRADLQYWEVDLDTRQASIVKVGWRRVNRKA
ncbi:MAG: hypothetical protein WAK31_22500 [Chthoniobacterales bacterium]